MIDSVRVGNKIASERRRCKLTQDDLASHLYVTRQLVSKWEQGYGVPTIDSVISLAKLFSISIDELLCLDEENDIDENNLFIGRSREAVITNIIKGNIKVNLEDVFYQFSPTERLLLLKTIKSGKIETNMDDLLPCLTSGERNYLIKENANYDIKKIK